MENKAKTKIFLDSGNPDKTKQILDVLGYLDGQTTNPTLISRNPDAKRKMEQGEGFTEEEILSFYKDVIKEVYEYIPEGSVSIEVYADKNTTAEEMMKEARLMNSWVPGAHIKLPTNEEGLKAAEQSIKEGIRVNMTLCFTQEQAAAVYAATRGAKKGDVFVSPFIGRLDDIGENGMDLIKNIMKMYKEDGDGHVEVLAASVRTIEHFMCSLYYNADIVTAPFDVLKEWGEGGLKVPDDSFKYNTEGMQAIKYKQLDLDKNWDEFDIKHELTDKGIKRFAEDWNKLMVQ